MIDADGNVSANPSQNSDSLTSELDRQLLKHLRSISDLIVTTGATISMSSMSGGYFCNDFFNSPSFICLFLLGWIRVGTTLRTSPCWHTV